VATSREFYAHFLLGRDNPGFNAFDVHRKAIADFGSKATSSGIVAELATLAHEDGHAPISSCANIRDFTCRTYRRPVWRSASFLFVMNRE
jgi:hypothetical protein